MTAFTDILGNTIYSYYICKQIFNIPFVSKIGLPLFKHYIIMEVSDIQVHHMYYCTRPCCKVYDLSYNCEFKNSMSLYASHVLHL